MGLRRPPTRSQDSEGEDERTKCDDVSDDVSDVSEEMFRDRAATKFDKDGQCSKD